MASMINAQHDIMWPPSNFNWKVLEILFWERYMKNKEKVTLSGQQEPLAAFNVLLRQLPDDSASERWKAGRNFSCFLIIAFSLNRSNAIHQEQITDQSAFISFRHMHGKGQWEGEEVGNGVYRVYLSEASDVAAFSDSSCAFDKTHSYESSVGARLTVVKLDTLCLIFFAFGLVDENCKTGGGLIFLMHASQINEFKRDYPRIFPSIHSLYPIS
jgi:hypothetical protein